MQKEKLTLWIIVSLLLIQLALATPRNYGAGVYGTASYGIDDIQPVIPSSSSSTSETSKTKSSSINTTTNIEGDLDVVPGVDNELFLDFTFDNVIDKLNDVYKTIKVGLKDSWNNETGVLNRTKNLAKESVDNVVGGFKRNMTVSLILIGVVGGVFLLKRKKNSKSGLIRIR